MTQKGVCAIGPQILLIGATGTFGSRLATLLLRQPGHVLVLAGRTPVSLAALRARLLADHPHAQVETRVFDREHPADLALIRTWLVIDAAGPFQGAGYDLALAAVRTGAHYIDLADGRAFVAGFEAALGTEARAAGLLAVTGASSTPALSHAALAPLVAGWTGIDDVLVAISPGARAPRGLAVMQAILSYAGRPLRLFRGGAWTQAAGWSGTRRLDMPGLSRRFASICDTPDLDLLPARFPIRRDALFLAGLELPLMHLGLAALSWPVRCGVAGSLRPLAPMLRHAADMLARFGTDRGGMIVEASGQDAEGHACRARWGLWAEADAGPTVPAAAAAALVRALLAGLPMPPGAHVAAGLLDLDDIMDELAHLPIFTRVDIGWPDDPVLFRRLLGPRFDALPPPVRTVHGGQTERRFTGHAIARCAPGLPGYVLRHLLGLPPTGRHAVEVTIAPTPEGERWTRGFGASRFASHLDGTARLGIFEERFGPLRFVFELRRTPRGVDWRLVGWRLGPVPLPLSVAPDVRAAGEGAGTLYRFRVVVAHRWLGPLFAYRGMLDVAL